MKIAVIGAGIIGVTTAYELAKDGHEVTVFERRGAAAEETSFANAGIVAPGYVTPWASPGMPAKALRYLFSRHAAVKLAFPFSTRELSWIWRWYRSCQLETYLTNRAHLQKLAFYSRNRLRQLTTDLQLDYERSDGYMVLLRSEKDRLGVQPGLQVLREAEVQFKEITPAQARKIEPALNPDTSFLGAIHLPEDEVGNCRQFALLIKNEAQKLGAQFEFNTAITDINAAEGVSIGVLSEKLPRKFDATVICAGLESVKLLKTLRLNIPLVAVHGYSVSANIREPLDAPRSAVMDEHYKVAISRLGNRVRVAGCAEVGGDITNKSEGALTTLYKVLQDWFPGAAHLSNGVQEWKGARPMLPDGPPIVGKSGLPGVWLNLGHGSSGWALSCGSARLLADQLNGKSPDIDHAGFAVERLRI
jgi:D-amino-acid dehydrogenase